MSGKKAVVVGASQGIGWAISQHLFNSGYEIVGIFRALSKNLVSPPWARIIRQDLSRPEELEVFSKDLAKQEGDADAVIFCAGAGRFAPLESLAFADIQYVLNLNLLAPIVMSRAFVPLFKKRRRGDFIFIGSEAAHTAGPRGTAYCASKFGLRGFVKSLRIECAARGVRVSLINPGMTVTGFYDDLDFEPGKQESQHLRPDDIAAAVDMVLTAPPGSVFDEINLTPVSKVLEFKNRV